MKQTYHQISNHWSLRETFSNGMFELVVFKGTFWERNQNHNKKFEFLLTPMILEKENIPPKCQILKEDLGNLDEFLVAVCLLLVKSKLLFRSLKAVLLSWLSIVFAGKKGGSKRQDLVRSTNKKGRLYGEHVRNTLQGTNISPTNGILKMIFLFPRWDPWDMLVTWRVSLTTLSLLLLKVPDVHFSTCSFRCRQYL